MVIVPTQKFVANFFSCVILSSYWLYVTYKISNELIWMAKDPSNFVELVEEEEVEDSNTVADTLGCGVPPTDK